MPASSNRRRTGPGGQTIASARSSRASSAQGAQHHAKAAGIEEIEVAEVKDERPGRVADRGVERRLQRRHRIQIDLTPNGDARRSVQLGLDDRKGLGRAHRFFLPVPRRFFLPVLRRNRSVTVVRGEGFARLLLTNRPVTAERTRVM